MPIPKDQNHTLQPFEIEVAGFNGGGGTDDRILWVAAMTIGEVMTAVEGFGAKVIDIFGPDLDDIGDAIDYVLPQDVLALRQRLSEFSKA